jgi:hypothetical protein
MSSFLAAHVLLDPLTDKQEEINEQNDDKKNTQKFKCFVI